METEIVELDTLFGVEKHLNIDLYRETDQGREYVTGVVIDKNDILEVLGLA